MNRDDVRRIALDASKLRRTNGTDYLRHLHDAHEFRFGDVNAIHMEAYLAFQRYAADLCSADAFRMPFDNVLYIFRNSKSNSQMAAHILTDMVGIAFHVYHDDGQHIRLHTMITRYEDVVLGAETNEMEFMVRHCDGFFLQSGVDQWDIKPSSGIDGFGKLLQGMRTIVRTCIALTAMMQSKDVEQRIVAPDEKLNNARAKAGKTRLRPYISVIVGGQSTARSVSGAINRASPVTHWRRGHVRRVGENVVAVAPCIVNASGAKPNRRPYVIAPRSKRLTTNEG